tara:strand:+ start:602 stop:1144 length:543 start_codon:yes stop_codon:yes gene_type:complete
MLKQTTQSTLVVSTAEAKAHMHVDHDEDDTEIAAYNRAAQSAIEERTRRSFAGAVFVETATTRTTVLSRTPVDSVDTVKINTTAGEAIDTTLTVGDDYRLDLTTGEALLVLDASVDFAEVEITWTAGSTDDLNMKNLLRHAVLMLLATWYEGRETIVVGTIAAPLPLGVDAICGMYASTN